jgi:3-deoxy-manno-octulosonate cytidylyltransferase (CMP-KDO synthetase)
MSNVLTIIPARLASNRLPNKPLADIAGKSMIARVYNQAQKANLGEVYVACDGEEIANEIIKIGGKAIITPANLPSGTDRIFWAAKQIKNYQNFDIIVNLQGDLPVIDPKIITATAELASQSDADIATIASIIKNKDEIQNPNVVKIALASLKNNIGEALYFSRSAIPHNAEIYYHHIGIYAYKTSALEKFVNLKPSFLEKTESLEQLRALENNMKIMVKIVDSHPFSVDTNDDLEKVKSFIKINE